MNYYIQLSYLVFLIIPSISTVDLISYSQKDYRGIPFDQMLCRIMNYKNGVFVEVGAYDGIESSNTKLLEEKYGWTGILVEPSEVLFSRLCANRPNSKCLKCALGSFQEDGTYGWGDFDGSPMSSLTGRTGRQVKIKVLIRSLQSILDEYNLRHINFFSLDTEGYELNILKGIDFNKTKFDYILIEIYTCQYNDIVSLLLSKGYEMIKCFSNYNKYSNPGWDGTHNDYLFKRKNL